MNDEFPFDNHTISIFRGQLMLWGKENIRYYPWRYQEDPYKILVSEFMLHRTQTCQVIPVFEKFISNFPTLEDFFKADQKKIVEILESLGLDWRIKGMIDALIEIWNKYKEVPVDYEKLTNIRGIGQYIAGATICFSKNYNITLVDTNVVRVVGRVFGLDLKGEARRRKSMIAAISTVCNPDNPRDFYYAVIDLAHTICLPQKPNCQLCPMRNIPCQFTINPYENK